jgi:UDP-N-acetyl-D-mannosaminuronic acid dehydrogenase
MPFSSDVCVVGGAGHVGLPLALTFADSNLKTVIYDINGAKLEQIGKGVMPFAEEGGQEMLDRVLANGRLSFTTEPAPINACEFIVIIVGTPVDEHLNPSFTVIYKVLDECLEHLRDGQTLILRSTVFPGTTEHVQQYLGDRGLNVLVAFCPERVAQGHSLREFRELPQVIGACDSSAAENAKRLFGRFTTEFVEMTPTEAELCKLMTNAWRYVQFATVNQFYMVATQHGLNFDRILHGCRYKYPRMAGMSAPGFAAGPCLVKDTMQLAAFSQNNFVLGHSAMLVNEGLPAFLVELAKQQCKLSKLTSGILGMAFKAESDDNRDSLSYKLRRLLSLESRKVLCTDPYVPDGLLVPLQQVLQEADVLFLATPHSVYRNLEIPPGKLVIDVWSCLKGSSP